jgi:hypothetical protein
MTVGNYLTRPTAAMRSLAVLSLGALAVHQTRYLFGYGGDAGAALAQQGHAYISSAVPILLAVAVAAALCSGVAGRFGDTARSRPPAAGRTLAYAITLVITYSVQELTESILASGHPAGLGGLFGHGGWIVFPLALLVGFLAWLAVRGLEAIEAHFVPRPDAPAVPRAPVSIGAARRRQGPGPILQTSPLASGVARRPPPVAAT